MEDMDKILGKFIRTTRKQKNLTQGYLAEKSDLSIDTIGRIERGSFSPSHRTLLKILHVLDAEWIINGQPRSEEAVTIINIVDTMNEKQIEIALRLIKALVEGESK